MLGIYVKIDRRLVLLALLTILIGLFILVPLGLRALKRADHQFLGYTLTDIYARARGAENWFGAAKLPVAASYAWAQSDKSGHIRIAHALGAWEIPEDRNTMRALHRSLDAGFNLLEVDLSLGPDGGLYCYHGISGKKSNPSSIPVARVCKYQDLIRELRKGSFYLVLDLKDNFARSAYQISQNTPSDLRNRIIFQIYQPNDLKVFKSLPFGFAGPIVTLYRSRRTIHHLGPTLESIGARVVAVPIERVSEFKEFSQKNTCIMLTHPIKNAAVLDNLKYYGFLGGYMDNSVK